MPNGARTGVEPAEGAGVKTKCCKSYKHKGKACKKCPVMARLDPKAQKQLLKRYK